ncbi:MAG: AsnC family transcriptional regulator [Clostridia bacterium]|nr:AsnC family transcriptional regulator [Clostridia bacterium]
MDNIDKQLLNIIQRGFPICSQPYQQLADELGTSEEEIIEKIAKLKEEGIIRRLGGIFDSKKLGYKSTLCAIKVPQEKIQEVKEVINSYKGVTHNYLREHNYNMWFTLIVPGAEAIDDVLAEMRRETGIDDIINLPAVNFFKINVNFDLNEV